MRARAPERRRRSEGLEDDAMKELESSHLSGYEYYPDGRLVVYFRGGRAYTYKDVPSEVAKGLDTAESAGKFFHANIRDKYAYK
jgi:hypothetical protein